MQQPFFYKFDFIASLTMSSFILDAFLGFYAKAVTGSTNLGTQEVKSFADYLAAVLANGDPLEIREPSLWEASGSSAVPRSINVKQAFETFFANEEIRNAYLNEEYGINSSVSSIEVSIAPNNEAGSWDGSNYTPNAAIAFSSQSVAFEISFIIDEFPNGELDSDGNYLTSQSERQLVPVELNFDRSGLTTATSLEQDAIKGSFSANSTNGLNTVLAFADQLNAVPTIDLQDANIKTTATTQLSPSNVSLSGDGYLITSNTAPTATTTNEISLLNSRSELISTPRLKTTYRPSDF